MDTKWLHRKPLCKLDRFALEYVTWRGLHPFDCRGAPWIKDPTKQVFTGSRVSVMQALSAAWSNTKGWRAGKNG